MSYNAHNAKEPWDQYSDYLDLERILGAQQRRSEAARSEGRQPAHDEMLFIIFHQVYELWFKQILFELDDIQGRFQDKIVNDRDLGPVINQLGRIVLILRTVVQQLDILETMNPQSFVDFREHLRSASGFQSWQFRLMEIRLGLKREGRLKFNYHDYDEHMAEAHKAALRGAEGRKTLYEQVDQWLARTPFVEDGDYTFWASYRKAVGEMFDQRAAFLKSQGIEDEAMQAELAAIEKGRKKFEALFDREAHAKMAAEGMWRMSWRALQSALFISIYRDEPVLHMPYRLLSHLMDIDELLSKWRYAHALMVQRMVGVSMGSGGSAGYGYLMQTLEKHRIYEDLFALSTYLIPSRMLPALPERISDAMGYTYSSGKAA